MSHRVKFKVITGAFTKFVWTMKANRGTRQYVCAFNSHPEGGEWFDAYIKVGRKRTLPLKVVQWSKLPREMRDIVPDPDNLSDEFIREAINRRGAWACAVARAIMENNGVKVAKNQRLFLAIAQSIQVARLTPSGG